MIQFSWRLLEFSAFFFSFVGAINLGTIIKNINKIDVIVIATISTLSLIPLYDKYIEYNDNINNIDYQTAVRVTKDTGRVHAGCASFEYLPTKAFKNLDYIIERSNNAEVLSGNANITNQIKENTNMTLEIQTFAENTLIELPYIYYIGYDVYLIDECGNSVKLKSSESDKGFIQILLPNITKGIIKVSYKGTLLMRISYILSGFGILLLIVLIIYNIKKENNKER